MHWTLTQALVSGAGAGLLSAPHCAGMCGPLSSAVCMRSGASGPWRYQAGRFASYAFGGMLAGHVGGVASGIASRVLPVWLFPASVALALGIWALRVWRGARTPKAPLVQIGRAPKTAGLLYRLVPRDPLFFGVISALLPCGALISAWALAALAGTPLGGALTMLAFALTTGAGVVASSWLLRGIAALRRVWVSRALAIALFAAALVVIARPIFAHATHQAGAHASCH